MEIFSAEVGKIKYCRQILLEIRIFFQGNDPLTPKRKAFHYETILNG